MIPGLNNTEPENIHTESIHEKHDSIMNTPDTSESSSESSDSDSDYLSFDDSDDDEDAVQAKAAREREKQRVLEAAGLIVNQNVGPAPLRPKAKSIKRRPAPAAPRRMPSILTKDLPPVPDTEPEVEADAAEPEPEPISHEARLDDAFARYESFKNTHAATALNRLSVVSTDSAGASAAGASPTTTVSSMSLAPSTSQGSQREVGASGEGRYSGFLHFLTGGKGAGHAESEPRRTVASMNISAPMMMATNSSSSQGTPGEGPTRSNSPSFGMVRGVSAAYFGVCLLGLCLSGMRSRGRASWTKMRWMGSRRANASGRRLFSS